MSEDDVHRKLEEAVAAAARANGVARAALIIGVLGLGLPIAPT